MDNVDYFSDNYDAARGLFLAALEKRNIKVESRPLPLPGPNGQTLYTDIATIGSLNAEGHLLLSSATHGVEGFCGSACQTHGLEQGLFDKLPDGVAVTLIHAINPYGFAWLRRVNEDNVDLNRNFIDFEKLPLTNPDYESLLAAIIPESLGDQDLARANKTLGEYGKLKGFDQLQATLTEGQYEFEEGVYFGGKQATWSNQMFRAVITDRLANARRALMIDYHTGLGPYGHGELISEYAPASEAFNRAQSIFPDITSTIGGDSSSAKLQGTIDFAFEDTLTNSIVTALTLEFGTRDGAKVFAATRADNWLHLHGDLDSAEGRAVKAAIRDAFYPEFDDWKEMVIARSEEVLSKALAALA